MAPPAKRPFTIAHSLGADDAFLFCGLATGMIGSDLLEFQHVLKDIQSLNQDARERSNLGSPSHLAGNRPKAACRAPAEEYMEPKLS